MDNSSRVSLADRVIALVLSYRVPLLAGLGVVCGLALTGAYKAEDDFVQGWLVEVFGSTLLFLAVLGINPSKSSINALGILLSIAAFVVVMSFLMRHSQPAGSLLTEAAASLLLFVLLEAILGRLLSAAASRERKLAAQVAMARQEALDRVKEFVSRQMPDFDMSKYEENLDHLVFGDAGRPIAAVHEPDDPAWVQGWREWSAKQ